MKNIIAFLLYCLSVTAMVAQSDGETRLDVPVKSTSETILEFTMGNPVFTNVTTPLGASVIVGFDGGTPLLEAGMPDLSKYALALQIPNAGNMVVEVLESDYTDMADIRVAPSKGNLLRNVDPATVPYAFGETYLHDNFYPGRMTDLQRPFNMRGVRGQALWLYPVQYNPVTKVLRVYHHLKLRVYDAGGAGENEIISAIPGSLPPSFESLLSGMMVNYTPREAGRSNNATTEKMLVIAQDNFIPELEALVTWKRQMGIHTTVVPVSEVGGSDATTVYNFVKDYYLQNGITYLLLVGDENAINPQMRPSGGQNYSCDNCFGYMDGDDHFPEVFVGRFNAATIDQLKIMVARNLEYEKNPLVDEQENWCATGMASASNEGQGIGDDGQADYQHANALKEQHLADGYEKVWEFYDGNHAAISPTPGDESADQADNPVNTSLVQLMNNRGVSLYNYTGHGWEQGLASGNFNTDAVAQLRNDGRYPILIAVACCAGNFTNNGAGDCLGEAWQRAGDSGAGQPWGGIAGFFSSDFQSWAPPMEGQDGMNQFLVDADGITLRPSIGSMLSYGNALMIAAYDQGGEVMADFWNPFAEPSTVPRTRLPQPLVASHQAGLFIGTSSITVNSGVEGALVALYWEGQTLATAYVQDGEAILDFPALTLVGDLVITVSQFNHIPYQGTVPVVPSAGPYVVSQNVQIQDPTGDNDQKADYGETVTLDLELTNIGFDIAMATSVTLSSSDAYLTLGDVDEFVGDLADSTTVALPGAFGFSVANNVPDGHVALLTLHLTFNDTLGYNVPLSVVLQAPELDATIVSIQDYPNGDSDGRLESGEKALVKIRNFNTGASLSPDATGVLSTNSPWLTISPAANLGTIDASTGMIEHVFTVDVSPLAPQVQTAQFNYQLSAGAYGATVQTQAFVINPILESFESHDFEAYPWVMGGDKPWVIASPMAYTGAYSSRSGNITHSQSSTMQLSMIVSDTGSVSFARRVSTEEGYDWLRFFIDGVEMGAWSGIHEWGELTYPISAGLHTLLWVYEKDDIYSANSDRCWVDDISLPPHQLVVPTNNPIIGLSSLKASPNPTSGYMQISLQLEEEQDLKWRVFDQLGRVVVEQTVGLRAGAGQWSKQIDLNGQPAGIYFVEVYGEQGSTTLKVVKQ